MTKKTSTPSPNTDVVDEVRAIIDRAKNAAAVLDASSVTVVLDKHHPEYAVQVSRKKPRTSKAEEADPSNVQIASDPKMVALLVARVHEIRADKRALSDEEDAVKSILETLIGELEYMALAEGEVPVFSMRHESSLRVNSAAIREQLPPEEHPDLYTPSTSRPLRLI